MNRETPRLECDLEVSRALELLAASGVASAPVVDDNQVLVGVVSATKLTRGEHRDVEVEDVMHTDLITVSARTTMAEAAQLMADHELERIPVVSVDGRLLGVISAMDVIRWMRSSRP